MKVLFFLLFSFLTLQLWAQNKLTQDENPGKTDSARNANRLFELARQEKIRQMPKPKESGYFTTGREMNLFNVRDINNNRVNLKEAKGKIIVINFWFINCSPCRREIPELNGLVDSFKTNDKVVFIGVALDGKSDLENFLQKLPFKYTVIDNGRFMTDRYGVRSYPTHLVIDPESKVYFHTSGLAQNTVYWIKKSIEELLVKEEKDVAAQ